MPTSLSSPVVEYELNDYAAGMDNYTGNDKFPVKNHGTNKWRLAQNARILTSGEYETRKGFDYHSGVAATLATTAVNTGTTGAALQTFDETAWVAQKWTAGSSGLLLATEVNIKNAGSVATGTVLIEHWTDNAGSPGTFVTRSSVAASEVGTSLAYLRAYFPDAPAIVNGTVYWIIVTVQPSGTTGYTWSSNTSTTTAKTSSDSGSSWSSASFTMNYRTYAVPDSGGVKGMHRAIKSDGTKVTIFAQGTGLWSVDAGTGAVTAIKTGLSANATAYRFLTVNDIVYYVNGYDGYRKWDFTTESQVNVTNYSDINLHKGLVFLTRADDRSRVDFSNFGLYETFTSTDFFYVPAPKTGDNVASFTSLNGYAVIRTQNRAYILSGDENATFRLDEAPDQKGTYTAETSVSDNNYEYFLSDDGVYRSNGTQPELLSENIYETIRNLPNKDDCCMAVNKGRLYLWYTSAEGSSNDACYVWNLNYKTTSDTVESHDTRAYVARAISSYNDDDDLLVGSSRLGSIMWQEKDSNDYTNLGGDIDFELRTHYFIGSSPAILKETRYWLARFGAADDNYTCACDYAYDLRDNWETHTEPDVQGVGSIWGQETWGSFIWGSTSEVNISTYIPGEYRRTAIRYKHDATRQPQKFLGHSFRTQERRMR